MQKQGRRFLSRHYHGQPSIRLKLENLAFHTKFSRFCLPPPKDTPAWSYPRKPLDIITRNKAHTSGRSRISKYALVWSKNFKIWIATSDCLFLNLFGRASLNSQTWHSMYTSMATALSGCYGVLSFEFGPLSCNPNDMREMGTNACYEAMIMVRTRTCWNPILLTV